MEFFNLPISSKVDKNIPKEIIYKNAEANEKFKRIFKESVEKIRYEYALSSERSRESGPGELSLQYKEEI
mgnify:CR=1 FL=1